MAISMSYKTQKRLLLLIFLALPMALLLTFSYYPAVKLLQLSFMKWNGISTTTSFIGVTNYVEMFQDGAIFRTLLNNGAYLVITIIQTVAGLYFAIILNTRMRFSNFFKSALFSPYILNGVAIAFMFSFLYNYDSSPVNAILRAVGLGRYAIKWLGVGYFSNFSLAFIGLWKYTGFSMVIFLGALKSIPEELYEAAEMDGASFWQKTRYITLPSIKTVVQINLFLSINGALQAFFEAFVITKGGPAGRTNTFVTQTVSTAFEFHNFGRASAMGVVLMLIVIALVSVQRTILREET